MMLANCSTYTTVRHMKDYQKSLKEGSQILIVPPDIEVHMVGAFSHKERMYQYEYHLEELIYEQLRNSFEENGFRVKILNKKNIADLKLNENFYSFRTKYNSAKEELYKPLTMLTQQAYDSQKNIGGEAKVIGIATNCKFLIITDYNRSVKTNGARTLDFAASLLLGSHDGANNADTGVMFIGIVEAASGDILWANFSVKTRDIYTSAFDNLSDRDKVDAQHLKELIIAILEPLKSSK